MSLELAESSSAQPETVVDMESLLQEQEGYVARPGEIRKGRVIQVTEDGALVDVGLKREGFVPASDLRQVRKEMGEIHEGDEVFVKLLESESEGYIKASIYQARLEEDWIRAEEMLKSGALYEGRISSYNRGGLTVPFGRIRGFIPVSQVVGIPRPERGGAAPATGRDGRPDRWLAGGGRQPGREAAYPFPTARPPGMAAHPPEAVAG